MNNVFNKVQMLETSDVCNKFSKSVSYETLVGGTATTGTGIKQTRRLIKGTADKPLTAVGTLTSLRCNSAKVMEKFFKKNFRDDSSFCFGFAKVTALAFILSLCTISESLAECTINEWYPNSTTCFDSWNPGKPDNCGDGCTYTYNNGKLTVTATKPDAVVSSRGIFSPVYYEPGIYPNVTDIEIDGEFKSISPNAFLYGNANISGKDGVLHLKNVNYNIVQGNTLTGTILISDDVTEITGQWYYANLDATVIIPPSVQSINPLALQGLWLGENAKIYCGVENCEELFRNVNCDGVEYAKSCKSHLETLLSSGKLLAYPDGCAKMGASGCIKCKNENFKLNDGECDRLRYTPAEAAEVLTDDNNNSVTITFKM